MGVAERRLVYDKSLKTFRPHETTAFLRGPIPWAWLKVASSLSGKSFQVGLALWHLLRLQGGLPVRLSKWTLEDLNVTTKRAREALLRLEEAGLVRVERKRGSLPRVELLTPVDQVDASDTPALHMTDDVQDGGP